MNNDELAAQLKAGDEKAYGALILENRGLAMELVNEFAATNRHLKDDLEGEALLALTEATHQLRKSYEPGVNVTGYLYKSIRHALAHFLDREGVITVPDRTRRRARAEGKPIAVPCKTLVEDVCTHDAEQLEVIEELQVCAKSDSERQIIDLLISGQTAEQIALNTGLSIHTVQSYARRIRNRFETRSLAI